MAQLGAHRIRSLLSDGKPGILDDIRPSSVGTAAHFTKALGQAPMLEVMNFIDKQKGEQLVNALLQHADDLDYLQELISSVAKQSSLNPTLNAVAQAYSRRRFTGRFKAEGQSVDLDTLVHQSTKSSKDDDAVNKIKIKDKSERLCWAFQRGTCLWQSCIFQHRCSLCSAKAHGAIGCPRGRTDRSTADLVPRAARADRPPHPRYRRDRAVNTEST